MRIPILSGTRFLDWWSPSILTQAGQSIIIRNAEYQELKNIVLAM